MIHIIIIYLDDDVCKSLMHTDVSIGGNGLNQLDFMNPIFNKKELFKLY